MGKSLKGKELGKNISQRKDGRYQARFINRFGQRQTIYANTLNEIRSKLREEQYNDAKEINVVSNNVTLDEWFKIWLDTCKQGCRASTKETYTIHYKRVQADLGWRKITALNLVVMQDAINKLCSDNARKNSKKILVELCGLTWEDVDFKDKLLHVRHTLCYFSKGGKYVFEIHDTKTDNGERTIPLTDKAFWVLKKQRVRKQEIIFKGKIPLEGYENLVFVTRNNRPTQQFLVQECMNLIIHRIQQVNNSFEAFTPHTFRHTFATRAIENSMQPKVLSKLLGHGQLQITMDLYCHVMEDTLVDEMKKMERKCV